MKVDITNTDKKYDIYTMSVKEGTYSFRAVSTDRKSLGGGTQNARRCH